LRFQSLWIKRLACAALTMMAGGSQAALTVFTSQASFLGSVSSPGVDGFNGFSITDSTPSPLSRVAGSYTYTASTGSSGFFGAGTNADPWLSTDTNTDSITFSGFGAGVSAIGGNFFGSELEGAFVTGTISLTATDSFGAITTQNIVNATTNSFLGFVSTGALTSLVVSAIQPPSDFVWPTVNNLILAQAVSPSVPEPQTYALMLAGLGLVGLIARRRKHNTA